MIPVSLVTGFLGSGKSSLVNRILARHPERTFGLIVNEFGDVALESQILQAHEDDIVELKNGCMCCVLRDDLLDAVARLLRRPEIDHIIVEASGLSDPIPIIQTFQTNSLEGSIRLASVICVVDPLSFRVARETYTVTMRQLNQADYVVVSKSDVSGNAAARALAEELRSMVTRTSVFAVPEETPLSAIFDVPEQPGDTAAVLSGRGARERRESDEHTPEYAAVTVAPSFTHDPVASVYFTSTDPLDAETFEEVMENLPAGVVRVKGILYVSRIDGRYVKYILQYAGGRRENFPAPWGRNETRQTALLFLGMGFDAAALKTRLDACVVPSAGS